MRHEERIYLQAVYVANPSRVEIIPKKRLFAIKLLLNKRERCYETLSISIATNYRGSQPMTGNYLALNLVIEKIGDMFSISMIASIETESVDWVRFTLRHTLANEQYRRRDDVIHIQYTICSTEMPSKLSSLNVAQHLSLWAASWGGLSCSSSFSSQSDDEDETLFQAILSLRWISLFNFSNYKLAVKWMKGSIIEMKNFHLIFTCVSWYV